MADQLTDVYNSYANGYLLRSAQKTVVRGFELSGLFPMKGVPTKKVNVIDSTPVDQFVDKTGKMKKVAKGARVRQIRGEVSTAGGLKLTSHEIEYVIENEDILEPGFDLVGEINGLAYVLSCEVEETVAAAVRANAQIAADSSKVHGDWDNTATTLEHIISDVTEFEGTARLTPYRLNWFAGGNRANIELVKRAGVSVENYTIPQNEFTIDSSINFMNAQHFYGGKYMNDGELFAGDVNNPGLRIFYKDYQNPNMKAAPMPQGLEKLAPPMRMLMYDNSDKEAEPETIIKLALAVGAYPINKGAGLFKYSDILS